MANTIQLKRTAYNAGGTPSSLSYGELAWDNLNEVMYIGKGTATTPDVINLGNAIVKIASDTVVGRAKFSTNDFTVSGTGNVQIKTGGVSGGQIADGAISTAKIGDDQVTAAKIVDDITLNGNCGVDGSWTVTGDLTVNGTTTTVNSTVTTIDDPVITVGGDTAPGSDDGKDKGIELRYYDTAARLGFMGWDNSEGKFTMFKAATNTSEVFSGTLADLKIGGLVATSIDGATVDGGSYIGS